MPTKERSDIAITRHSRLEQMGFEDPQGYVNGANLYQLEMDDPVDSLDPTGLLKVGPGNTIIVQPGDTPGGIARKLTGDFDQWQQIFPDLNDPTQLQTGTYNVDPAIMAKYNQKNPQPAPAKQPSKPPAKPPTSQPASTCTPDKNGVIKQKMWVTAYDDTGLTSHGKQAGPGTVAAGDTHWKKTPNTPRGKGEYRDCPDGTPAHPAFPYGSKVQITDDNGKTIYEGTIQDTGRGWIRNGIPSNDWLDIWISDPTQARQFGLKQYNVVITPPAK